MSNEILAALIGVAGGLVVGFIGAYASLRAVKRADDLQDVVERRDTVVNFLADFLTEYTAEQAKENPSDVLPDLDRQLERIYKNLYLRGYQGLATQVHNEGRSYLAALKRYAEGKLSADDLNKQRVRTRNSIAEKMKDISRR